MNIADEDWPLLTAWMGATLRPRGPYPLLVLNGEWGSAKSTTARVIRALTDPNAASLRAAPRNEHDLVIAAHNGWLVALDNLSRVQPWLSDALCRLATGGGFAARRLYTDAEEVLFDAMRPILLIGIEELPTRGDLIDRSVITTLPRITDERRQAEESFWPAFEQARPELLGAILTALSTAMRRLPGVSLTRLPRMADFARLAVAAEPALGVPRPRFGRRRAQEISVDDVAKLIVALQTEGKAGWTIRYALTTLSSLMNWAVRRGMVPANPVRQLERSERPKVAHKRQCVFERNEIGRLLATAPAIYRPIIATALFSGMRLMELLGNAKLDLNRDAKPVLHDCRHTFASLLIAQGLDVVFISRQLGHSTPATTLRVYAHLFDEANHASGMRNVLSAQFGSLLSGNAVETTPAMRRNNRSPTWRN